jgi:hypothetical protein
MLTHANPARLYVEVSIGEVLDKISILEIKKQRMRDPSQLANVRAELTALAAACQSLALDAPDIVRLRRELSAVNTQLWEIEDDIRRCENDRDFGPRFITLARLVYKTNDQRAEIKRRLNQALGSRLIEEKSYASAS